MLRVASVWIPCCMLLYVVELLLGVVARSLKQVKRLSKQHPTFFCSVNAKACRSNVGPLCTALPTLLGPTRALNMVSKVLCVVSFPGCTAGPNIVVSSCIRLHTTANTEATEIRNMKFRFEC